MSAERVTSSSHKEICLFSVNSHDNHPSQCTAAVWHRELPPSALSQTGNVSKASTSCGMALWYTTAGAHCRVHSSDDQKIILQLPGDRRTCKGGRVATVRPAIRGSGVLRPFPLHPP